MCRSIPEIKQLFSTAVEVGVVLALVLLIGLAMPTESQAQGPARTTISDTVYRADGSTASGTVLISWPSFQTAAGDTVAAGNLSVTIGPLGAFTAQLVPNVGASPAGTYYVVVFQLDDGTVRTEYWAVPATSPTTIAAVLTTPGNGLGNLAATQQYVDGAVANRAIDSTVVHLAGTETITGSKQFAVPPALPAPTGANDAANKGYVDAAVANVGTGSYVAKAGDTMTGPLTLPSDPVAPNQAADQHYVDSGLAVKADLINGTVPTGELGAGVATAGTCLTGNSTWGACGGGAPAGITYATTALNWTQTISSPLTGGSQATVTLTPCPIGIDTTSGAGYQVLLSGGGNSEAVNVLTTAGACTSGAASGTITLTPFYSYAAGYTVGSASSGIQETLNAGCGVDPTSWKNSQCNVTIPANGPNTSINTYNVFGTLYLHSNQSVLSGYGTTLNCRGRGACLQIGDLKNSNNFTSNTISGLTFRAPVNFAGSAAYAGVAITQTQRSSQVVTITTATPHGFRVGDMVTILFTDASSYWGDAIVTAVPNSTSFQYAHAGPDVAAQSTPGVVALAYVAVLDNAMNSHLVDISFDKVGEAGRFNNFFDLWDDENATIEHFNNQASSLNSGANWTSSFVFSAGNQSSQIAPVITLRDSTITANYSNGVTVYNSNGLYIENTVLQATGPWQVYSSNSTGNYQGAYLKNIYAESTTSANPQSPAHSPFPGLGIAGLIAGASSGAASFQIVGNGGMQGAFQAGPAPTANTAISEAGTTVTVASTLNPGTGTNNVIIAGSSVGGYNGTWSVTSSNATQFQFTAGSSGLATCSSNCGTSAGAVAYTYYIVANDTTAGTQTAPMQILNWQSTGNDSIPVRWPRVANGTDTISYDVIRMASPGGLGGVYPYSGGCPGGTGSACGYVAKGLSQTAACSGGLVCTYTDSGSSSTAAYAIKVGSYSGTLNFWPGSIVAVNKSVVVDTDEINTVGVGLGGSPLQVASQCANYGATSPGGYTTCLANTSYINSGVANQTGTIITDGDLVSGGMTLTKGRLNFSSAPTTTLQPHHIITLVDSQPGLTQSTWGFRPPASANDNWIGVDGSALLNAAPLAFGSPVSITNYIGQTGDGTHANWLERLSATLKEFNVPVKFDQNVTLAGLSNGCLNVASGVIASTGSACGSGGGGGVTSIFGRSGVVMAATGDYTVSQVTGAAADASVVHNTGNETIAGAKTFTGNVTMSGNLILPAGFGFAPAVGGIGLDTAAGLPVVNVAGTTQQIALTSSNISGQAGTALALAATPTQCSGSFATGIAANGNANCTTANVIQLSETAQPAGIPNWGVFWFDSATHTPRVIDNNGQVTQLGLSNLFNSDPGGDPADNLEERNGGTAQNLRVYSTYTNNATWTRMSLGYDSASGYPVLRSEDATSGNAVGLGMYIGSSLKWAFTGTGALKPNTDNSYDIGTDAGQAMRSVFAKTSFNIYSTGRQDFEFANDTTSGTTLNQLAVYNSAGTGAQTAGTSSTDGVIGIVSGGAGAANKAVITWAGVAACSFDAGSPTAGDYVIASATQAGKCHDTGSVTRPTGAQVIGRVEASGVRVSLAPPIGTGGGAVGSVFGRTGNVIAGNGDYSVSQVTGAAADAAVVHLTGAETISGAKTFSSDVTLSGNLNVSGNINQMGTGPTQWSGKEWTGTTVTVPSGMDFSLGIGSDNSLKCQLASGASCLGAYVPTSTTVNGHALSSNVAVAPADLAAGALVSGMTAATQSAGDNSTKLATTAYVDAGRSVPWAIVPRCSNGSGTFPLSANKALIYGVLLTYPLSTSKFGYYVNTADNTSNTYDVALYAGVASSADNRLLHIGSTAGTTFAPSTGYHSINWAEGATTLQPGRYYLMFTASATASQAALSVDSSFGTFFSSGTSGVSITTGGSSPSTFTSSADAWVPAASNFPCVWLQ